MQIPEGIFKSYDIRGIYPDQLNEENIVPIVRAIYKFFQLRYPGKEKLRIVLGRDMRLSSPSLFKVASETLVKLGADVIDPGIVSTPTFYYTVFHYGYDAGFQISASHNPKEYNGLKIVVNSEKGLLKIGKSTGMDEIKRMAIDGVDLVEMDGGKMIVQEGILAEEYENAVKIAGNPEIRKFKVVADPANAMGGPYIEEVFKHLDCELVKMNFELDGSFPAHQPDPIQPETLVDLQAKVKAEHADLGLAPDGDGDRLFFIDENGDVVPPSIITALAARELLKGESHSAKATRDKMIVDLKYILTPKYWVEKMGGELLISKTGHAFITELMQTSGALFAGEASGHYYFKEAGGGEAQMPVILMVLSVMTREGKTLSEITKELSVSSESGEINFKVKNAKEIMEKAKEKFSDGEYSDLDGTGITFPDWRFTLRSSNTEPLLRLNVEAKDEIKMKEGKEKVMEVINEVAEFEEDSSGH